MKKLISILMILTMSFSMIPVNALAADAPDDEVRVETATYINPIYAGVISEDDLIPLDQEMTLAEADGSSEYIDSLEVAGSIFLLQRADGCLLLRLSGGLGNDTGL